MTKPVPGHFAEANASANRWYETVALVLQGGGALGAYQAGVYEALSEAGYDPTWFAGVSIGAINATILAGNPPERRVERLREFWTLITSGIDWPLIFDLDFARQAYNSLSAATVAAAGLPGFFDPRVPPPFFQPAGSRAATSFYDTSPLRATLERLVDFDLLNSGRVRLSLGSVDVESGNSTYFDTRFRKIGPEHAMASGALPPGFPAIEIDGRWYWDGGIVSNSPLSDVLECPLRRHTLVFEVDLFSAAGMLPRDIMESEERRKDLLFSSRTRQNTSEYREKYALRQAILKLGELLPDHLKSSEEVQHLLRHGDSRSAAVVHLIYRSKAFETHEKDYEFSRRSMLDHWSAGLSDMRRTLEQPSWLTPPRPEEGVRVFDMLRDQIKPHHDGTMEKPA